MKKNLKDIGFISILIFIVAVGIYWMIYEFRKDGLDHYINLLGDRLLAMVPKENDKKEIGVLYDEFRQNVKDKKVDPEQIEEVAADILNMSNRDDIISVADAESVLCIAVVHPIEKEIEIEEVQAPPEISEIARAEDEEKWQNLNERLRSVYDFNLNLKQKMKQSPSLKNKFKIHIGNRLNIILDEDMKELIEHEMDLELHKDIINLQKEYVIVWSESLETKLEAELDGLSDELNKLFEENTINFNRLGEIRGVDLKSIADSVKILKEYISDSLQVKIESIQEDVE